MVTSCTQRTCGMLLPFYFGSVTFSLTFHCSRCSSITIPQEGTTCAAAILQIYVRVVCAFDFKASLKIQFFIKEWFILPCTNIKFGIKCHVIIIWMPLVAYEANAKHTLLTRIFSSSRVYLLTGGNWVGTVNAWPLIHMPLTPTLCGRWHAALLKEDLINKLHTWLWFHVYLGHRAPHHWLIQGKQLCVCTRVYSCCPTISPRAWANAC